MGITGLRRLLQGKKVPIVDLVPDPPKPIEKPETKKGKYLWLLDAGHGDDTPGKRSIKIDGVQLFEWEYNRKVRDYLGEMLREAKYDSYFITSHNVKWDVQLNERVRIANNIVDRDNVIFISMHADAYGKGIKWQKPHGVSVWIHRDCTQETKDIASIFVRNISEATGWRNRGVKEAGYYVTNPDNINCPSILSENGFFTNERECAQMQTEEYQRRVAMGHFNAIKEMEG